MIYLISYIFYLISLCTALFFLNNFNAAQVLSQALRHHDRAVGTLVLLHQSGEDPGGGQTGAIEGVNKFGLAGFLTAEADIATAVCEGRIRRGSYEPGAR